MLTADQIKFTRETLGRTQEGMARIVGCSNLSWGRWERGETAPLPIYETILTKLYDFAKKQTDGVVYEIDEIY